MSNQFAFRRSPHGSFWHFDDLGQCAALVRDARNNGHAGKVSKPTRMTRLRYPPRSMVSPALFQWLCPCCSPLSYAGSGRPVRMSCITSNTRTPSSFGIVQLVDGVSHIVLFTQVIRSKARTAGITNIFIALGDLSEIGRHAAVRRENVDLKDQAAAPRIVVHHVRERCVGEQSSVPILFPFDLDRRKAGWYCPTCHNIARDEL